MELRHLKYFVAVAEEMNIHRAAKRLNISQPPLSLTIKQLEKEIGTSLFTREGRGIKITRAGKEFLSYAEKILSDAKEAKSSAKLVGQGKKGVIKLGFISSAVTGILQKVVHDFKQAVPEVKLEISQSVNGTLGEKILNEEFDLALIRWPEYLPPGLTVHMLTRESWFAACPDNDYFANKKDITIESLSKEKLLFYPRYNNPAGYDEISELFRRKNVSFNVVQEAPEQMTLAALVASGMGIAIVPECMTRIPVSGLTHLALSGTKNRTGFAIIHRTEKDALTKAFIESLKLQPFKTYLTG